MCHQGSKGRKNMSFAALVVVGDPSAGRRGFRFRQAKEVPQAIARVSKRPRRPGPREPFGNHHPSPGAGPVRFRTCALEAGARKAQASLPVVPYARS